MAESAQQPKRLKPPDEGNADPTSANWNAQDVPTSTSAPDASAALPGTGFVLCLRVLNYSRVPSGLLLLALVLLALSEQGRDMLAALPTADWSHQGGFILATVSLSLQLWFWARQMLHDRFGYQGLSAKNRPVFSDLQLLQSPVLERRVTLLILYWPRVLALSLVLLSAGFVSWGSGGITEFTIVLVLIAAAEFALFRWRRRQPNEDASEIVSRSPCSLNPQQAGLPEFSQRPTAFWRRLSPVHQVVAATGGGLSLLAALAGLILPVSTGLNLGAGAVLYLSLGFLLSVLGTVAFAFRERGAPITAVLASLYVLSGVSAYFLGDNHQIRSSAGTPAQTTPLETALAQFIDQHPLGKESGERPLPLVVVATAGGGLRAGYFTVKALLMLQQSDPTFARDVFAISGVSGGALGATAWVTWNHALTSQQQSKCPDKLLEFFSPDYLGPVVQSMLQTDMFQRILPGPQWLPDRAQYLELGWEHGFDSALHSCGGTKGAFGAPYTDLWRDNDSKRWIPHLLNNGMHQETGRRIITSGISFHPEVFPETIEFYETQAKTADGQSVDLPTSSAALNAARFPFFSPAGTLADGSGHIVDGGYLENFGARTALDLLQALAITPKRRRIRPIVLQIVTDSNLSDKSALSTTGEDTRHPSLFDDLIGPFRGVLAARSGRSLEASSQLRKWVTTDGANHFDRPVYVQLALNILPNGSEPAPLGWALSAKARENMDEQLNTGHNNHSHLSRLLRVIRGENLQE